MTFMRRIVVTGMGMVSPLGGDLESTWKALQEGRSGVGPITLFDAKTFPTRIAAEVADFRLERYIEDSPRWDEHCRNSKFAIAAAQMAYDHSGLATCATLDRTRFGVYLGSGEGQQDFPRFVELVNRTARDGKVDTSSFTRLGLRQLHAIHEAEQEAGTPAGHLASLFGAQGPNANCLTACAASSQAIGEAVEIIRHGDADVMLSGGTHSMIHPFGVTGFNLLTALSTHNDEPTRASRPFDRDRDGFILGEGAGMLILEELEHARRRRAAIFGEMVGYGSTADAFRITDSHDEGRGAIACMREALGRRYELEPRGRRLHQRPWHQHLGQRLDRDAGDQAHFRLRRLQCADLEHEEHDGPPDRGGRQRGGDRLSAHDPRRRRAAHNQPRPSRPRL